MSSRNPFSLRTVLMGTVSPAALWSDITPDAPATPIAVDNLSTFGANVRRERTPEMRVSDELSYADAINMNRDFRDTLAALEVGAQ